jgi:hypothetical protein
VLLDKGGGTLFGITTYLAYHDNGVGIWISLKHLKEVDKVESGYGVSADSHGCGLTDPCPG